MTTRVTKTYSLPKETIVAIKKLSDETNIPQSRLLEMGIKMLFDLVTTEQKTKEA